MKTYLLAGCTTLLLGLVIAAAGSAHGEPPDTGAPAAVTGQPSVVENQSIQAAIDAHPGKMIFVPAGDYRIDAKLRIATDNSGLFGPGRIIQTNPEAPILEIERASGVQIRDITMTRAEGQMGTLSEGILAVECRDLAIDNVRVIDNRSRAAAISLRQCADSSVRHCLVRNYSRISIDDRTASTELYGYAFSCIDGTGIGVNHSSGTLLEGNRIVEENLLPTPEIKERFGLGKFVKKNSEKPAAMSQKVWDAEYVNNWHQGSAIIVTAPEASDHTRILGNWIQNAAQGIDLHCDRAIVAQNIVDNAFIGMKAMHGSRHVLITGNQFSRNDLWAIGLMPGAAASPTNPDGGSIILGNIISDFGHGSSNWIWGNENAPLKFDTGQLPDDPPPTDVIVQGNILYGETPRYRYAVIIPSGEKGPRGLHFTGNLFHPGTAGIANVPLPP